MSMCQWFNWQGTFNGARALLDTFAHRLIVPSGCT